MLRKVGDQLVVDRGVGCEDEEVLGAPCEEQEGDERAHQPGLADAGGNGEAHRRELALEGADARVELLHCGEGDSHVEVLAELHRLDKFGEDIERLLLRRTQ